MFDALNMLIFKKISFQISLPDKYRFLFIFFLTACFTSVLDL